MTDGEPVADANVRVGRPTWSLWWCLLAGQLIALVVLAAFVPTLKAEFVDWDDPWVLVDNTAYRGLGPQQLRWMFTAYHAGHYQPITWITYGLDYLVWGMDPTGYHLTNNLFHALNAFLVFILARSLLHRVPSLAAIAVSARGWWRIEIAAVAVALLFGLHPLRVESVAWATERRDVVSAFFVLLTVLAYLRSVTGVARRRWLAASLILYVLSMLSKIGGAPLPFVLLVLDWYPLRRLPGTFTRSTMMVLLEKLPFLAIAAFFSVATLIAQSDSWALPIEWHGPMARSAQAAWGLVFYVWKTVLPTGLLPLYELHVPLDPWRPRYVIAMLAVLAGLIAGITLRRRWPGLLAAILCYGAMVGPLLGFFQNGPQIVADRYSYLSTLSWTILAAGAATLLVVRFGRIASALSIALTIAVLSTLAVLTWRQCAVWRTSDTLWEYMISRDPDSSYAQNGWGCILLNRGRPVESVPHFERAIEIDPFTRNAWLNLWNALRGLRRIEDLRRSCEAGTESPRITVRAEAHLRLGRLAQDERDFDVAIEHYRNAVDVYPHLTEARLDLARLLLRDGNVAEAREHLEFVLAYEPDNREARVMMDGEVMRSTTPP